MDSRVISRLVDLGERQWVDSWVEFRENNETRTNTRVDSRVKKRLVDLRVKTD